MTYYWVGFKTVYGDFVVAEALLLEACLPRALDSHLHELPELRGRLAPLADEGRLGSLVLEKFLLGPQHQRLGSRSAPWTHTAHLLRTLPKPTALGVPSDLTQPWGWGFFRNFTSFPICLLWLFLCSPSAVLYSELLHTMWLYAFPKSSPV